MKVTIETSVIKTILSETSANCLSALVALKETLAKVKKPTDEVPTLKQVAKAHGLQERTIKKFIPYLINKRFLEIELIPTEWVSEMKGKITKEVQKVIDIVTEAALNAEEPNSVNDDVIVKVKAVNSITVMKKVYCLLPLILSNHYLNEKIVDKLDKDWITRPLDKTRYKDQLKFNREWKKKQQELQDKKVVEQTKTAEKEAIEVDAEPIGVADKETQQRLLNKQNNKPLSKKYKYFQNSKNNQRYNGLRR